MAHLLSLWVATAAQGCPNAAAVVSVRDGGCSLAAFSTLPVCGDRSAHAQTVATLDAIAETASPATSVALKVTRLLGELETYVCGQSDFIIDYATARRRKEPISTPVTENAVQWLLHRRMNAQQQMRWTPRGV